jgi:protein-S-isoprenylcysteine O-methyltransferase Ste14
VPALLPIAALAYLMLTVVFPVLRLRRRTGSLGIKLLDRRSSQRERLTSLGLGVCLAGVLVWTITYATVGPSALFVWPVQLWVGVLGWLCFLLGTLGTVAAQAQMGSSWRIGIDSLRTSLVTTGLYAFVRNPIFTGVLLTLMGLVVLIPSPWLLLLVTAVFLLVRVQVRAEERHLTRLHGEDYLAYASRVGRFLPGIGMLRN